MHKQAMLRLCLELLPCSRCQLLSQQLSSHN